VQNYYTTTQWNWRMIEIPTPKACASTPLRTGGRPRRLNHPNWRKAENTIPIGLPLPFAFQAAAIPDRLTFRGG
jgi:hypothetical protein